MYSELGVSLTFTPDPDRVVIESRPVCAQVRVGEAFDPASTPALLRGEVPLRAA